MMQQSQTLFESSVLSATSFRTVYHEHGRYKTINGNSFVHDGHAYRINTRIGSGVRHDILISTINELNAILKLYSRVFLTRFDLHLPEFTSVEAGNKYIRLRLGLRTGKGFTTPLPLLDCTSTSFGKMVWNARKRDRWYYYGNLDETDRW
ncbi:hypothetical protein [Enterobacter sp.]|uniref:hypothetical protein n=1 Tax=Enterobacter sp. TaxID=42895 RepID=UPI003966F29D